MDHFLDIKVLPDPEFSDAMLMNALFAKLHRRLVELGHHTVAVSFPQAGKNLGNRLRLHGKREALEVLESVQWRKGLSDYTRVYRLMPVPAVVTEHRIVRRKQSKSSAERLRRRAIKRYGITVEEAEKRIPADVEKTLHLPFVTLRSQSNGEHFRLFIDQSKTLEQPVEGSFSRYGLSAEATVPWF